MSRSSDPHTVRATDWERIEATITAFEAAWIRGDRPTIADHLAAASPHPRCVLVELVHAELEFRLKAASRRGWRST